MNLPIVIGRGSVIGLHDQEITIAEVLKKTGHNTAMVDKWHLVITRLSFCLLCRPNLI